MIKTFVEAWDVNKGKLEDYFKTHKMGEYSTYLDLVRLLFGYVINPYLVDRGKNVYCTDADEVTVIDNGEYQGTQLFALHIDAYQPSASEYVFTYQEYGSCSGCDILQAIQSYDFEKLPDDEQVKEHMTLCLHLLQRCKALFSYKELVEDR